ncbi:hypothetical protein F4778DRAFT_277779 [Xylariomycetidae sp. FL2044]|nr:hypothetical protein F4778DRAFT_277779 [Xylariomycetidae sp. FL2044]
MDTPSRSTERQGTRIRVQNACDRCKFRKVKCDGKLPCGYCLRQNGSAPLCQYSAPRRRAHPHAHPRSPPSSVQDNGTGQHRNRESSPTPLDLPSQNQQDVHTPRAPTHLLSDGTVEDETEVPREARLLCDAQGKLVFIGDCAPLSFFQSVRHMVTSLVDPEAFSPQTGRFSALENAPTSHATSGLGLPDVPRETIKTAVAEYLSMTAGLVDLFDSTHLSENITLWATHSSRSGDITNAVNYLVLAIGCQKDWKDRAQVYFDYAQNQALKHLNADLSISTVQAFVLVTLYLLGACQINGAFLFFGIAVRSAYSIGIHRTEVNARFGTRVHRQRDRLWRSLRVLDLFLSTSMGRPPATSDVDCTVPYRSSGADGGDELDMLNASVQIFLILEGIVVEIYSRRKISMQLTEGISRQLRDWSSQWLPQLKSMVNRANEINHADLNGLCRVLSSYYYAVMLVSRPFLMHEVCRRLSGDASPVSKRGTISGKLKLADACVDAASLMVDLIADMVQRGILSSKNPIIVSWLFASSLALGIGLLGQFGRILERYARKSIVAMEHFAKSDTHAVQYCLIAQTLLSTALSHLERQDMEERLQKAESSGQLFGLMPVETTPLDRDRGSNIRVSQKSSSPLVGGSPGERPPLVGHAVTGREHLLNSFSLFDDAGSGFPSLHGLVPTPSDLFYVNSDFESDINSGAFNLFPLLDTNGSIDLTHHI